ncbi:MAG: hypothetical protein BRC37_01130, partial [Cyanobacteria bacterium QH_3_48_40]
SPADKLEQMGRVGAERVRQQHDAARETSQLAALFRSNLESLQGQAASKTSIEEVGYANIHTIH